MKSSFTATPFQIAVGRGNRGLVKNATVTWGRLCAKLSKPTVTGEDFKTYQKLSRDQKNDLKNVDGYWIGAHCKDGRRSSRNIEYRHVACFDIDAIDGGLLEEIKMGVSGISGYEFFAHSSRSHTPDQPRLRIVFLLNDNIRAEQYEPVVRLLAQKLDPDMETVDPVSFRVAQMMYFPSCSIDMEKHFFAFHNPGEPADGEKLLAEFPGNWMDRSQLPKAKDEDELRQKAAKAEDPTSKSGIVGAFCRQFPISAAIAEFLPDVYVPSEEDGSHDRYTYVGGEAASGVVVYDDDKFIYSYHHSDPCGDQLVNSFDMVRLHKFESLDQDKHEALTITQKPSFKAMAELAKTYDKVRRDLIRDQGDPTTWFQDESHFGDTGDAGEEKVDVSSDDEAAMQALVGESDAGTVTKADKEPYDENWIEKLDITETGFKNTLPNISMILQNDRRTRGIFAYNEFTQVEILARTFKPLVEGVPTFRVHDVRNGDPLQDVMEHAVRAVLETNRFRGGYGLKVADRDLRGALEISARVRQFHPVRRRMRAAAWDGQGRIERLFIDYVGAPDDEYHREVAKLMMIAAVARVHEPGHKFDFVTVLEGAQGIGKSTFWRFLAFDQYFTELHGDISDRQAMVERMAGNFIVEFAELASLYKKEAQEAKDFISASHDQVRLAYRRNADRFFRQNVFVASTNETEYLKDRTGNRRYWPVQCDIKNARYVTTLEEMIARGVKVDTDKLPADSDFGKPMIDTERLRGDVDQLWAEAVHLYDEMRRVRPKSHGDLFLALSGEAAMTAEAKQESRRETTQEDIMAQEVSKRLEDHYPISVMTGEVADARFDNQDDIGYARWDCVTLTQVWTDILGHKLDDLDNRKIKSLSTAMGSVPGWEYVGRKRHPAWSGQHRAYVRQGLSYDPFTDPEDRLFTRVEDDAAIDSII